ncbi:hypothetical protein AGLY_016837 [Aphis glycines]|uniref:Uncharacterized protein n=1 Tax=Aphis glycines TaxID=307491 RepID=A0A6G0SXE5_APHGL|nr:hypothetical protein AGLY_016837 [Aphis glycines]
MKTVGNCSLLTVISIKDIRFAVENHPQRHSICSRKPPSMFVIGAFFRLVMLYKETKKKLYVFKLKSYLNIDLVEFRFYVRFALFGLFFFSFMSFIMKTFGKCSLLTVISIKDIRFAVENHPHSLFAVFGHFFFVYLNYFENCWEMFTFNGYKHQGHSICSRKPPSKFVIGAFFRLKSINNSKNIYLFENSTIHR